MNKFRLLFLGISVIIFGGLNSSNGQISQDDLMTDWLVERWTPYEVLYCFPKTTKDICFIYVEPKYFTKKGMSNLAEHFSKWFPEIRKGVNFNLYDDRNMVRGFIRSIKDGCVDPGIHKRRGHYVRAYGRETLVYKTGRKGDEFDDAIRIK